MNCLVDTLSRYENVHINYEIIIGYYIYIENIGRGRSSYIYDKS